MCPCYSRGTHQTLEKPSAQNVTACESHGKYKDFSRKIIWVAIAADKKGQRHEKCSWGFGGAPGCSGVLCMNST